MANGKKIIFKQNARNGILAGILEAAKTAAVTFGPRGRTVAFDKGAQFRPTKDGITVLNTIQYTDELKNFGAMLLKEASSKSNYQGGDGSTSTAILTAELCKAAAKLLNQGIDINDLRDGYRIARNWVMKELETYKKTIQSEDDIFNIAKISANNDEEIANYIKEAFTQIGDNGVVTIADSFSRTGETMVKLTSGIEFDRGFCSSLSVNSPNDQAIFDDPAIILSSQILNEPDLLATMTQTLILNKKPIVFIAPDFDDEVLAWFREQLSKKTIHGALVLAPGVSKESINNNLIDYSVLLDAEILYQDKDPNDFNFDADSSFSNFGKCERIIISKGKTTIIGPKTAEERFNKHIANLNAKVHANDAEFAYSEYEIETIKERIARMSGGVATILVGALTAPELGEKKDRYEDAVNAVRGSLNDGYIAGAGIPLLRISYSDIPRSVSIGVNTAISEYLRAIRVPAKMLISSTGRDHESVIPEILKNDTNGFNAKTATIEDIIKTGIIDPYKVILNSVVYATNVAEQFMSVDAVIVSDIPNLSIEYIDDLLKDE